MSSPTLRPYQLRAVAAMAQEVGIVGPGYRQSTLAAQATGTGKTHEIATLVKLEHKRRKGRVIVTAPRRELLEQTEKAIRLWNPHLGEVDIGWEQADRRSHSGHKIILASIATLRQPERLRALPKPDLFIHDEAHLEVDMLRHLAKTFPEARRIGLTATPDRADLKHIIPSPFEAVHPDAIYELSHAIEDGYLVPIRARIAWAQTWRLKEVATTRSGDLETDSLSAFMRQTELVGQVARIAHFETEDRPTIVFCVDLAHAKDIEQTLNGWQPGCARVVHGGMTRIERKEALEAFEGGEYRIILTVVLLTFGWDCPPASAGVMARPTTSRSLWTQSIGRLLRLYPGKEDALVLDVWGGSEDLSLVTPADALEPVWDSIEEKEAREVEKETQDDVEELLDGAVEPEIAIPIPAAAYELTAVNLQLECIGIEVAKANSHRMASKGQQDALRRFGLADVEGLTADQASQLLEDLTARAEKGLSTLKQARFLQRKGLNPDVPFELAQDAITQIRNNLWAVPKHLWADPKLRVRGSRPIISDGVNE